MGGRRDEHDVRALSRARPSRADAEGRGDYCFVGRKPRCSYCCALGIWQVRPPTLRPGLSARVHL